MGPPLVGFVRSLPLFGAGKLVSDFVHLVRIFSIDKCGWFSWFGKLCIWLRNTNGKCRRIVPPPPSPPFCSLFRSTLDRIHRRRSTSRCTHGPAFQRCPISDSFRKNWASSRSKRGPSSTALCAQDCTVSIGSCTSFGRCPASVLYCWLVRETLRRSDPSNCHQQPGRKEAASNRCAPYTSRSFRDICILVSSLSKRAAKTKDNHCLVYMSSIVSNSSVVDEIKKCN